MGAYDYAFLNDPVAQQKTNNTISMSEVAPEQYDAIYFVGGKGAMYDFPDNPYIQSIISNYYVSGKVIGAVCHGPAALTHVTLPDGSPLLANKKVSSFTNQEELFLIPDADEIFPFLLQSELTKQGATFEEGSMYHNQVTQDGNLVTGQNPWSTWTVAETMIMQLGFQPKMRTITAEEHAGSVLISYDNEGIAKAKVTLDDFYMENGVKPDRALIAVHSIIAVMQLDIFKAIDMIRLVSYAKSLSEEMS
jgi:putative intracellular protease/amidase